MPEVAVVAPKQLEELLEVVVAVRVVKVPELLVRQTLVVEVEVVVRAEQMVLLVDQAS
jgi:hypothetical protein